jgi:hypothetical protein
MLRSCLGWSSMLDYHGWDRVLRQTEVVNSISPPSLSCCARKRNGLLTSPRSTFQIPSRTSSVSTCSLVSVIGKLPNVDLSQSRTWASAPRTLAGFLCRQKRVSRISHPVVRDCRLRISSMSSYRERGTQESSARPSQRNQKSYEVKSGCFSLIQRSRPLMATGG